MMRCLNLPVMGLRTSPADCELKFESESDSEVSDLLDSRSCDEASSALSFLLSVFQACGTIEAFGSSFDGDSTLLTSKLDCAC